MIVAYILSGLALLTAATNIILFFVEKKRGLAQRKATLEYIDNVADGTLEEALCLIKEHLETVFEIKNNERIIHEESMNAEMGALRLAICKLEGEVEKLKSGATPDYDAAVAAAKAVNEFNVGISSILNFDPIAVARARRHSGEKEAD